MQRKVVEDLEQKLIEEKAKKKDLSHHLQVYSCLLYIFKKI